MEKKQPIKRAKKEVEHRGASKVNLLDNRIIYLCNDISEYSARGVVEDLLKLDNTKSKGDITMYINSPGGSVSDGLAIYDAMNMIESDIKTICIGRVASMGAIILSNGTKGKRFIMPNAEVMIHEVSTFSMGKLEKVKVDFEHTTKINERILKILSDNSGQSLEQVKKDTLKDNWLTSEEAIEYGICDKILR